MTYDEIYRRIFDKWMKSNPSKEMGYHTEASRLASVLQNLNKRELHDVYMVMKAIKR